MRFRAGLSYEKTQYVFDEINIKQYSIHTGITMPFGSINLIDISIAAGIRGTTESYLNKEKFIKGMVTISLGELWFVRNER